MSAELLLARLEGAQKSGPGWRAQCPACGGKSRKLSVLEVEDGRTLVHCFGGCEALAVVQALGLRLDELFQRRPQIMTPQQRQQARRRAREAQWGAALQMLELEARVALIAAKQLARWQQLDPEDDARLALALQRIEDAGALLRDPVRWSTGPERKSAKSVSATPARVVPIQGSAA